MPVYQVYCPHCGHGFQGMAFAGTRLPEQWICPQCGSDQAKVREDCPPVAHPLEASRGGCPCCGGAVHPDPGS